MCCSVKYFQWFYMSFRLPSMVMDIIKIMSKKKHILHASYLIHCAWARVRSDNYFALERLQKQSLWRRKTRRKKSEKLSVFTFLSSTSFALRRGFTQEQFPTITFLPRGNQKKSAQLGDFWWIFWKAIISNIVFTNFLQNRWESISVVCDDESCVRESFVQN